MYIQQTVFISGNGLHICALVHVRARASAGWAAPRQPLAHNMLKLTLICGSGCHVTAVHVLSIVLVSFPDLTLKRKKVWGSGLEGSYLA